MPARLQRVDDLIVASEQVGQRGREVEVFAFEVLVEVFVLDGFEEVLEQRDFLGKVRYICLLKWGIFVYIG